ncbi:hypothetical protein CONPUDRAFT_33268, partial [Coniophora puteana RWD-64-598 SS2]
DDIRVEHHPHSERPPQMFPFDKFQQYPAPDPEHVPSQKPWSPYFDLRLEFEIVELALETGMTVEQTDHFLELIHRACQEQDVITSVKHEDIRLKWEAACVRATPFKKEEVKALYEGVTGEYDVHYHNIWEWTKELLRDPRMFPQFTLDAQRLSKYNGDRFVRFFDKPYTADKFWEFQV